MGKNHGTPGSGDLRTADDKRSLLQMELIRAQGRGLTATDVGLGAYTWAGIHVDRVTTAFGAKWAIVTDDPTESVGVLLGASYAEAISVLEQMPRR